jgi:hypothetical protein
VSNKRHALVNAGVGFGSTRYGNMAIPLLLVTVDMPAALDDLPFSFGGMFGFTQFRASPTGMGRYESQPPMWGTTPHGVVSSLLGEDTI